MKPHWVAPYDLHDEALNERMVKVTIFDEAEREGGG